MQWKIKARRKKEAPRSRGDELNALRTMLGKLESTEEWDGENREEVLIGRCEGERVRTHDAVPTDASNTRTSKGTPHWFSVFLTTKALSDDRIKAKGLIVRQLQTVTRAMGPIMVNIENPGKLHIDGVHSLHGELCSGLL